MVELVKKRLPIFILIGIIVSFSCIRIFIFGVIAGIRLRWLADFLTLYAVKQVFYFRNVIFHL